LDLSRPCDAADLRTQLSNIVSAGAMRSDEAAGVDIGDVAWFFATHLGTRLRAGQTRVLREWPFVMGADPARYDPSAAGRDEQDVMLVRGIIDCLFDDGTGWEIIDYKTDAVNRDELAARAAEYRGQLRIYAAAAESVWQCRIPHCWLAFLSARRIVEV
jgi:ATP-dependent helicase/nuclease subunit A